jgi:hypothetical protein
MMVGHRVLPAPEVFPVHVVLGDLVNWLGG